MDSNLKERLIRIAAIGRQLIESEHDRDLVGRLEELGKELCDLSGVCGVCDGNGIHPGEDPEDFDGETPLARCPCCFGKGFSQELVCLAYCKIPFLRRPLVDEA